MRHYIPTHFSIEELMPESIIKEDEAKGRNKNTLWRYFAPKMLWTLDQLRNRYGPVIVNDYVYGGNNHQRGYRDPRSILVYNPETGKTETKYSSLGSQHCLGRAADCTFTRVTSEEVRQDILKHPTAVDFKYITALELGISWFHFDVRNWDRAKLGILTFYPFGL